MAAEDRVAMWEGYHHPGAVAPLQPPGEAAAGVVGHDLAHPAAASPTAGVLLRMPRLFPAAAAAAFRATRAVSVGSGGAPGNDEGWERSRRR